MTVKEDDKEVGAVNAAYVADAPKRKISSSVPPDLESIEENADAQEFQRKISVSSREVPPYRKISTGVKPSEHRLHSIHSLELGSVDQNRHINVAYLRQYAARSEAEQSWWFSICMKCRKKEVGAGWEPKIWQKVFPYPYFPTYRHMARCLALLLVGALAWVVVYSIVEEEAAPGGQLFNIAVLIIAAHFGAVFFRMLNLPGLVAMIFVGMLFQNFGLINIQGRYQYACAVLTKIALTIILTRAGLDLEPKAMKKLFWTILKLALIPWIIEALIFILLTHYLLDMPWMWSLLTGGIIAAVAPAVVVSALMRLREKGYGVAKGIPTLVIAISGLDDATSVAAFGIIQGFMFSEHSLAYNIALGPLCIVGGIAYGIVWGMLSQLLPEKGDPFVVPLRILMLLGGGLSALFGSEHLGIEGAGPLGVVAAAFVSMALWCRQGWDIEDNPVATAFEIFWMVFEPILFSLTGTQIHVNEIDFYVFKMSVLMVVLGTGIRILMTVLVAFGSILNLKERLFVAFCCMAKASVQAALAPVALDTVIRLGRGDTPDRQHAQLTVVICVISVLLTAPTGAITILLTGPRLLTKSSPPPEPPPTTHRLTKRLSIRTIAVQEDDGSEDHDIIRRTSYFERRRSSAVSSHPSPPPTITAGEHF